MYPAHITPSHLYEENDRLTGVPHSQGQILLWSCDAQGYFDFFSPSWLAFTGRNLASEQGQGWLKRVIPEDRELLWNEILLAIRDTRPWQRKFRLEHHDGTWRWMFMEGAVRYKQDGSLSGFIGYCQEQPPLEANHRALEQITGLLNHTQLLALMIDVNGKISFTNDKLKRLPGNTGVNLGQISFFDHFGTEHSSPLSDEGSSSGILFPESFETQTVGPHQHRIFWHSMVQRNYAGEFDGVVLIGEDVTEFRMEENQLFLTSKVFSSSKLAMAIVNRQGNMVSVNNAFTQLTGYSQEEALGQNPRILKSGCHGPEFYKEMWASINENGYWHGDIWDRRKDGTIYPKYLSINGLRDDKGVITHYSSIFSDITERKNIEEKLTHLAHHDALTKLPNRLQLERRLNQLLSEADTTNLLAILYIDLDGFKQVNDNLGHQAGDNVLVEVTRRIKNAVRVTDTVARVGGDEFIVLLPNNQSRATVDYIANQIVEALKQPIAQGEQSVICTPSIGISLCPDHGTNGDKLIQYADQAMYKIKETTRCGYHYFVPMS